MSKKIRAQEPIYRSACLISRDRHQLPDDAFERRWGKDVPICDCVDHNDPKFKTDKDSDEIDRLTSDPQTYSVHDEYQRNLDNNMPQAEVVMLSGRHIIPTCVNHCNSLFRHLMLGMEKHLQLLRPNLNPGEGDATQRRFKQNAYKRESARTEFLQKLSKRSDNGSSSQMFPIDEDWGPEGIEVYENNETPVTTNEIGDIMKQYMGWDRPDGE